MQKQNGPKILSLDIETSPILAYVWGLFDQNIALNQIKKDWYILAWSAKWLHDEPSKIIYQDLRGKKGADNDKKILKAIWKLIDKADILLTQNGKSFDIKKLNARFIEHGMTPPSSYKHIDVLRIARKNFAFTSNKLDYVTNKFNKKYKKYGHRKFSGFDLWLECLKNNPKAWKEMEIYNKLDVLALEEWYHKIAPWDNTVNMAPYYEGKSICSCGSTKFKKNGNFYSPTGKYQRYKCTKCGKEYKAGGNLIDKKHRKKMVK